MLMSSKRRVVMTMTKAINDNSTEEDGDGDGG